MVLVSKRFWVLFDAATQFGQPFGDWNLLAELVLLHLDISIHVCITIRTVSCEKLEREMPRSVPLDVLSIVLISLGESIVDWHNDQPRLRLKSMQAHIPPARTAIRLYPYLCVMPSAIRSTNARFSS